MKKILFKALVNSGTACLLLMVAAAICGVMHLPIPLIAFGVSLLFTVSDTLDIYEAYVEIKE